MSDLKGQVGEVRFTVEITRAATGEVETYEMVGTLEEEAQPEMDEGAGE